MCKAMTVNVVFVFDVAFPSSGRQLTWITESTGGRSSRVEGVDATDPTMSMPKPGSTGYST